MAMPNIPILRHQDWRHLLAYLMRHGGIATSESASGPVGVLKSYAIAKHGPDAGKVAFQLNYSSV
jgi:hypothetical protein